MSEPNRENEFLTPPEPEGPFDLAHVLVDELEAIRNLPAETKTELRDAGADLDKVFSTFYDQDLSAVCVSGGGIRSATFGLGIIQALAAHNLLRHVDYLSTVSGGGYLGSWLSAWIRVEQLKAVETEACADKHISIESYKKAKYGDFSEIDSIPVISPEQVRVIDDAVGDKMFGTNSYVARGVVEVQRQINTSLFPNRNNPNPEPSPICHLRQYSNFMTPATGLMSADTWAFFSIYIRNLFLNWTIFVPLIAALLLVPRMLFAAVKTYVEYVKDPNASPGPSRFLLAAGVIAGSFSIAYIVNKLPSKNYDDSAKKFSSDGWVLALGVLPLLISAVLFTVRWFALWAGGTIQPLPVNFVALTVTVYVLGYYSFILRRFTDWYQKQRPRPIGQSRYFGVIVGIFLLMAFQLQLLFWSVDPDRGTTLVLNEGVLVGRQWLQSMIFIGVPLVLLSRELIRRISADKYEFELTPTNSNTAWGLLSSITGGTILWLISESAAKVMTQLPFQSADRVAALYLTIAVPVFLLVFLAHTTLYVGLASKDTTDDDREWFARLGGWIFLISGIWIAVNGFVLLWPILLERIFFGGGPYLSIKSFLSTVLPFLTVLSGVVSLIGGFSSRLPIEKGSRNTFLGKFLAFAPQVASVFFLASLATLLAYGSAYLLFAISKQLPNYPAWIDGEAVVWNPVSVLDAVGNMSLNFLVPITVVLAAIGIFMAFRINVNTFSLHGAYRDRLIRAYLGASHLHRKPDPFTGFDERDNRQLHRLKRQKPFHILNATLNLLNGDNLAWQNRKAASFTMSPLHSGSWIVDYRRTNQYSRNTNAGPCKHYRYCNRVDTPCSKTVGEKGVEGCQLPGKSLRLGTAMAISGAAANPNMGYYSSAPVTFLLSLFNIRLGWWLGNTGKRGSTEDTSGNKYFTKPSPSIAVLPLLNETLGQTSEDKMYLNVTDGGHFENLAIYEMVRRRCQFIVVSDGAADAKFTFGEIANAIEKCKVDLGVEIRFRGKINIPSRNASEEERKKGQRFAVADIIYPASRHTERRKGCLLYLRPTLLGNEPVNITHYAKANTAFPHQSTGDQFFDEKQFEAYRELGFLTFEEIIANTPVRTMKGLKKHVCSRNQLTKTDGDDDGSVEEPPEIST